jgi:hypothetical protein
MISEALGRDGSDFRVRASAHGFHADNPPHGLAADFGRKGIVLRRGSEHWGLRLLGFGYGGASAVSNEVDPSSSANRVEYQHGPLTEWYVNGPMGLEQGFTLNEPPGPRNGQPLTIVLEMSGNLRAAAETGSNAMTLSGRDGETGIRYAGLSARDAAGQEFRAWLKVEGERLLLEADDSGARYPLVVDPFIQETFLVTAANAIHVAISGDNNTVAVTSDVGVSIFVDSGSGWNQVALLTYPNFRNSFCDSVALSNDGNTLVCGAAIVDSPVASGAGSVFVFVKPGFSWINMLPTAQLYGSDLGFNANFGASVAISDDGSTVLVGAPQPPPYGGVGAAYIFLRPSAGWGAPMTESGKLEPSDGVINGDFGFSVAISGDGHTAAVTDIPEGLVSGAGYVFVSPLPFWPPLTIAPASLLPLVLAKGFGFSMAMSRDANTVVIGAPDYATNQGAAFVFVKDPVLGWGFTTHEAAFLTASDGVACDNLGFSVSISGDGSHVLAGADYRTATNVPTGPPPGGGPPCESATPGGGAVYEFVSHAGTWSTETQDSVLVSPFVQGSLFGFSVAISYDTTRLVVSAANTNGTDIINQPNSPTSTAITSGLSTATVTGQGYSVDVSVASVAPGAGTPTGKVTVSDGSASCTATLSGGTGSCTLTSTTAGPKTITATYNSNGNYLGSSVTGSHTVNKADTALTVSSSENGSTFGDSVTFTATLSVKTPGSGTPTGISWTIDSQPAGTGSTLTIATLIVGTHTVSASYAGDSNFNGSSASLANGQKVSGYPVSAALTAPSRPYSDLETFTISVPNTMFNGLTATTAGTVVTFSIGTQTMGTCTLAASGGSNTCSLTTALIEPSATPAGVPTGTAANGQMAPGSRTVTASYTMNSNFLVTGNSGTLAIAQENATAVYSGNLFYGMGSATSGTIALSATIQDPGTTTGDPAYGDIRNARVTFIDRLTGDVFSGCANLPVGLVNMSNSTYGSASCATTVGLGTYEVATLVGYTNATTTNNLSYYTDNNPGEDTNVTVAQTGPGQITGGGHLQLTNSSGQLTPTNNGPGAQSHQNFGFSVADNKNGTSLQGHLNAIIRSQVDLNGNACSVSHPGYTTCVYQVKSTAISFLTLVKAPHALCPANTPTGSECASFASKGVINDVTLPNISSGIDGSVTMVVNMVDTGNRLTDMISFQINAGSNKGGGLWYSSDWTGTSTAEQALAAGSLSAQ